MSAATELFSVAGYHFDGEPCDTPPAPSSDGASRDALCGHGRLFVAVDVHKLTAEERVELGAPVFHAYGVTGAVYDLQTPCGCRWTSDGRALLRVSTPCLTAAAREAAQS